MKIKVGDQVVVTAGANKGKTGKVIRTLINKEDANKNKVVVEKVNMRKRHIRKSANRAGELVEFEAPIHVSNVMVVDPKDGKATRVGYNKPAKGKKVRIAKKSGQELK